MPDVTDRVDTDELARILHCSVRKARDILATGAIPSTFNGRRYTAARADVEKHLRATTITSAAQNPRRRKRRANPKD